MQGRGCMSKVYLEIVISRWNEAMVPDISKLGIVDLEIVVVKIFSWFA